MFPFGGLIKGVDNTLKLTNLTVSDFEVLGATYAGCKLNTDGNLQRKLQSTGWTDTHTNEWIHDESVAAGFDSSKYEGGYFSVTGDTAQLSTDFSVDAYHSLDLSPFWYLARSAIGNESVTGTLKVREKLNPSNEVTCTLVLSVFVDSGE